MRMDRTIIEGLQDIVSVLEDHLKPLVQAELSVLVDILYRPELLFPSGTEARRKCENGGFIRLASLFIVFCMDQMKGEILVCKKSLILPKLC